MSQFDWDCLEKQKQNIIEGKIACKLWGFEVLKGINDTLTKKEMSTVLKYFSCMDSMVIEGAYENLKRLVEDVISFRKIEEKKQDIIDEILKRMEDILTEEEMEKVFSGLRLEFDHEYKTIQRIINKIILERRGAIK